MADADADTLLVERAQKGDARAFEMLVVRYRRRIERLIGRMTRDDAMIQGLAQETFLRAWRALPQFRGESAFYTWLYRIAVNTARKALAEARRDPVLTESELAPVGEEDETFRPESEPINADTPEGLLATRQIAAAVNAAVDRLSGRHSAFPHFPRARGHFAATASAARHPRWPPLVVGEVAPTYSLLVDPCPALLNDVIHHAHATGRRRPALGAAGVFVTL